MTRINTNIGSLTAQHSLRKSNDALQTALTRLSTGLRINTGKDDPAGLIASEQLGSEITSISQSIKNSERAGNIIATADASLGEVSSLLNDVRNLVQSSANKGAVSADEIAANQVQVDNALDAITRIAQTTVFGGQKLLNGTKSFSVSGSLGAFNSPSDITINSFDPTLHTASANNDVSLTVNTQATKKTVALKGSDFNTGTSNSLLDLSVGTSTRTSKVLVTNDNSLADATSSLHSLSTTSTRATQTIEGAAGGLADMTGTTTDTVTFSVIGEWGTVAGIALEVADIEADSQVLADAINAVTAQTGIVATTAGGAQADITLTSLHVGASTVGAHFIDATAATVGGDVAEFDAARGAQVAGATGGALADRTTVFTITGNKGSADISTAALSSGGFTGNDVIINNDPTNGNTGLQAFVDLINTRTDSTGVVASINGSNNLVLTSQGVGSTSLAGISASVSADQTLISDTDTTTSTTGTDGTSNTSTFELIGDLGRAVITVNNDAVINDSTVLRNAINAVTTQTGLIASGGGFGVDVTLTASKYGSAGTVTVNALAASNSADITLLNAAGSRITVDGVNATGSLSHGKGGGTFIAAGERFSYTDSAISLDGTLDPTLTPAVRATRTIQDTTAGAGGLDSLTGTNAQTISFQLSGTVNGATVTTNITGVNVAALKADSRYLVDLINATSTSSGVRALTTGASGNIVLEATTAGANGTVGITATASTNGTDHGVFNLADTSTAIVAGSNPSVGNNFDVTGGALFQIGPTVNFANQINVNITSLDLATLGRDFSVTGNKALASLKTGGTDSLDKANLEDAAKVVDQAIGEVATLRGKLGAIQKNAIDSNIRSLQTSLEQVTSAKSTIKDADFAVETASLTRSQILVQAGTNVLALANQAPQNVLALLGR